MNLQTVMMILFSQRGRWVRMVEKEKRKPWRTSMETLKPLTRCVWQGHGGCHRCLGMPSTLWEALTSRHAVSVGETNSMYFRTNSCERPPAQAADTAGVCTEVMLYQYSFPLSLFLLLETFRTQAVPGPFVILAGTTQNGSPLPICSWHKCALVIHMDFTLLRLSPKISPWTLHTHPIIQRLKVSHLEVKGGSTFKNV